MKSCDVLAQKCQRERQPSSGRARATSAGFSLVGVIVSAAIVGGLALALVSIIKSSNVGTQHVSNKTAFTNFVNQLTNIAQKEPRCTQLLQGLDVSHANEDFHVNGAALGLSGAVGGGYLLTPALKLAPIRMIPDSTPSPSSVRIEVRPIEISLQQSALIAPQSVEFNVTTGADGIVSSCEATNASAFSVPAGGTVVKELPKYCFNGPGSATGCKILFTQVRSDNGRVRMWDVNIISNAGKAGTSYEGGYWYQNLNEAGDVAGKFIDSTASNTGDGGVLAGPWDREVTMTTPARALNAGAAITDPHDPKQWAFRNNTANWDTHITFEKR